MRYLILILFYGILSLNAQDNYSDLIPKYPENNKPGRKHIISFPMNEVETHPTQSLDVYIAAEQKANVKFYNKYNGFERTFTVEPGEIFLLSTVTGDLAWSFEVRQPGEVLQRAFIIESDLPVTVNVMNSKAVSTEGYTSLPVENWGTEYYNLSYYDFQEGRDWASGFQIMASENNTRVKIELKGIGEPFPTETGKRIGETVEITLDEGEVYMLKGTGTTRGVFDMSGSRITADKPIGVISFHQRTMIPAIVVSTGRDHLSEMLLPTDKWSSSYYTLELDRGKDKGDFFRIMAKEENTEFAVKWYDKNTGEQIGLWDGVLAEAGDFAEYHPNAGDACRGNNQFVSIRGTAEFMSVKDDGQGNIVENPEKPIQVMHYSYSACWDEAPGNFDPFMMVATPLENSQREFLFQTPLNKSGNDYLANFLNLIIQGDPNDLQKNLELLSSVTYDGTPIFEIDTNLFIQPIGDSTSPDFKGLYWASIETNIGPHKIESETEVTGFVYGFAQFDSYGWPINMATDLPATSQDTLKPLISSDKSDFEFQQEFNFTATELRQLDKPSNCEECLPQVDSRFLNGPVIVTNENFELDIDESVLASNPEEYNFTFKVIDSEQPAEVIFLVNDVSGNYVADTITYNGIDGSPLDDEKEFNDFNSNSAGRFFIATLPPNDANSPLNHEVQFLISSNEDNVVKIYNKDKSIDRVISIERNTQNILSSINDFPLNLFDLTDGINSDNTIFIEADYPITVFAISQKSVTSEGFYVLPVKNWGTEYYHNSYYDFSESKDWSSGFIVMAQEDGTQVEIALQGRGEEFQTNAGNSIGETLEITLNSGETYLVRGNGESRGVFDLSGSIISADKAIAVISYSERVMIPAIRVENGRSHLSEMLMPVNTWGKDFYTVNFDRGTDYGDFFRIMSSEPNTNFKARWYDPETKQILGFWSGNLENAGDFDEYFPDAASNCIEGNPYKAIHGLGVFEADKPVQLFQYSYSSCWDNTETGNDPHYSLITPIEQYSKEIRFSTPDKFAEAEYNNNAILIVQGSEDESDDFEIFRNISINAGELRNKSLNVNSNFDNMHFFEWKLDRNHNVITSMTPMGGIFYGVNDLDSYSMNFGNVAKDLTVIDTLAPVIEISENQLGEMSILVSENQNQEKPTNCDDCKKQEDSGIFNSIEIIASENITITLDESIDENWYKSPNGAKELRYKASVNDLSLDAKATIKFTDDYGNTSQEEINYVGLSVENQVYIGKNLLEINPNPAVNILNIQVGTPIETSIKIVDLNNKEMLRLSNLSLPNHVDVSSLSSGVYFITFENDGRTYKLKFVKS